MRGSREMLLGLLQLVLEQSPIDQAYAKKLRYARRVGYLQESGAGYSLTRKGHQTLSERLVWDPKIPTPARWDGKWHLVVFDIPHDKRRRRDSFRRRLREMGLTLYQNSVWLHPYPCEHEVGQVAKFYKLSPCVFFIKAETLSNEQILIKQYGL